MYAQFSDTASVPNNEEHSGSVNFGDNKPGHATSQQSCDPSNSENAINKKTVAVVVILLILTSLTVANFCMVLQARSESNFYSRTQKAILGMKKTTMARFRGHCRLSYAKSCFEIFWKAGLEYSGGSHLCQRVDGFPGNIYSTEHFRQIAAYLKHTQLSKGERVWLGMTYNATTGKTFYTNGIVVQYPMKWRSNSVLPINNTLYDRLGLHYGYDISRDGFENEIPRSKMQGVLCEINDTN